MARKTVGTTSPQRITGQQREAQAIQLRSSGASYEQIADALGYSQRDAAYKAVMRGLRRNAESYPESLEIVRDMSMRRLDQMLMAVMPAARQGDPTAIDRVLRLETRRAALLGLDAAKQVEARIEIDVMSWNQALKDFLDVYREFHKDSPEANDVIMRLDNIAQERFGDVI